MKKITRHISVAATIIAGIAFATSAHAKPPAHSKGKAKGVSEYVQLPGLVPNLVPAERQALPTWVQAKISYSKAKSAALSRYPGAKYIDMYLDGNVYRVKLMLRNNKVVEVTVDAVTGRVR